MVLLFFLKNVIIPMLPSWLGKIIKLSISFMSFMFNIIYWIFYFMVYPLKLIGWDLVEMLKGYFKNDCMTVNFNSPIKKMKDNVVGLIPKFKPLKI